MRVYAIPGELAVLGVLGRGDGSLMGCAVLRVAGGAEATVTELGSSTGPQMQ